MGRPLHDILGKRFGRLVVAKWAYKNDRGEHFWDCQCDCGKTVTLLTYKIEHRTRSCGCFRNECALKRATKHGAYKTQEYQSWRGLKQRCRLKTHPDFKNYGGRGIKFCERWNKFENFLSDMGLKPSPAHSIDRIDVNGDYTPENCRWATAYMQNNNKRKTAEYEKVNG